MHQPLAIVPVAIVGTITQDRYANVRRLEGLEPEKGLLAGTLDGPTTYREGHVTLEVDLLTGQKTVRRGDVILGIASSGLHTVTLTVTTARNSSVAVYGFTVTAQTAGGISGQVGASLQERITRDLRDAVFRHMQRLPLGWFSRMKTGQVMSRILADTEQAKAVLAEVATRTIQNLAQIVVTIVVLIRMSPRLALLSLVVAPVITAVLQPILRKLRRGHRTLRNEYGEITSVLQEVVSGVRLVKSFRAEPYEDARFTGASGSYTRGMVRITRLALLSGPITEVLGTVVAVGVLWLGAGAARQQRGRRDRPLRRAGARSPFRGCAVAASDARRDPAARPAAAGTPPSTRPGCSKARARNCCRA